MSYKKGIKKMKYTKEKLIEEEKRGKKIYMGWEKCGDGRKTEIAAL